MAADAGPFPAQPGHAPTIRPVFVRQHGGQPIQRECQHRIERRIKRSLPLELRHSRQAMQSPSERSGPNSAADLRPIGGAHHIVFAHVTPRYVFQGTKKQSCQAFVPVVAGSHPRFR
jgi:hypothetical protein